MAAGWLQRRYALAKLDTGAQLRQTQESGGRHHSARVSSMTLSNVCFVIFGRTGAGCRSARFEMKGKCSSWCRTVTGLWRLEANLGESPPSTHRTPTEKESDVSTGPAQSVSGNADGTVEEKQNVFMDRRTERRIRRHYVLTERGARPIWRPSSSRMEKPEKLGDAALRGRSRVPARQGAQLSKVRVLVLGVNAAAQKLAEELSLHPRVCSCYFVVDTTDATGIEAMKKHAFMLPLRGPLNEDEVLRVADWILADYVFQAPTDKAENEAVKLLDKEGLERVLAQHSVTFIDDTLSGILLSNRQALEALFRARDGADFPSSEHQ